MDNKKPNISRILIRNNHLTPPRKKLDYKAIASILQTPASFEVSDGIPTPLPQMASNGRLEALEALNFVQLTA